jgi:carboxypeptidase C (cathepsin A)
LPDFPKEIMKSNWYSGFYQVSKYKHLHYLFVESLSKPESDPVIVFYNGGPGGASIFLAFAGLSPIRVNPKNGNFSLSQFNYSWCNEANVLFIDNPAGVGYSYASRSIDDFHNDYSFSKDALSFMKQFYNDYSEFLDNPLYIAGASYGGIYAPSLAMTIHSYN